MWQGGDSGSLPMGILSKAIVVRGINIGSLQQSASIQTLVGRHAYRAFYRFEEMNRLLAAREIHPVVDRVFGFEEAQEAYRHLQSQKHIGKVVIQVAKA